MSEAAEGAESSPAAWQPLTFGGVAAFARARLGRLLLAQLVTAFLYSGTVVWFLHRDYLPVIVEAIQEMPETARIADGRLAGVDTTIIAENRFLAIAITPESSAQIGQSADTQIQFRPADYRVGWVFQPDWGWESEYGEGASLDLSRSKLEPWWGAWHPVLLTAAGLAAVLLLFGSWAVLALIYTIPAKLIALFGDRELSWGGAWRLGCAALLPGALLMGAATLLYARQTVDLVGLGFLFVAHLLIGWVYAAGGVWACPRFIPNLLKQNPFNS